MSNSSLGGQESDEDVDLICFKFCYNYCSFCYDLGQGKDCMHNFSNCLMVSVVLKTLAGGK